MTVFGIDISNWTGRLTPAHTSCMKAAGVQHCVVRASLETAEKGAITNQQLDALAAVGIDTSVYLWMYPSWNPEATVDDTVALLDGRPCRWFWIDAEDDGTSDSRRNVDWLWRAIESVERHGKVPGIYTGRWWWVMPETMANATQFKDIPLWTAEYDTDPNIDRWTPYGGWTRLTGKQYQGSGTARICGLAVDFNTFRDEVLTPVVEPPVEPPPIVVPPPGLTIDEARQWVVDDLDNAKVRFELRAAELDRRAAS